MGRPRRSWGSSIPLDHYRLYDAIGPDAPFVHIEDQFHRGPSGEEDLDLGKVR